MLFPDPVFLSIFDPGSQIPDPTTATTTKERGKNLQKI
jgi:hypothetical protein